jgi:predicted CXXCH cytochrome family protein
LDLEECPNQYGAMNRHSRIMGSLQLGVRTTVRTFNSRAHPHRSNRAGLTWRALFQRPHPKQRTCRTSTLERADSRAAGDFFTSPLPRLIREGPRPCGLRFEECSTPKPEKCGGGGDPSLMHNSICLFCHEHHTVPFKRFLRANRPRLCSANSCINPKGERPQVMQEWMRGLAHRSPLSAFSAGCRPICRPYCDSSIVRHVRGDCA